jgi:multidrug efflux pump subunit AcrA (membrane-fusion protein)
LRQGRRPRRATTHAVEAITLATRPVAQTTEFVGTVKSRRSTTVQPQVEGFITRIRARSGDRVGAGAPLMEIDPRTQQAAVSNLESNARRRRPTCNTRGSRPRA